MHCTIPTSSECGQIGSHSYTITSTDSMGDTSSVSGTFTVVAPIPPAITNVVVAEAGGNK